MSAGTIRCGDCIHLQPVMSRKAVHRGKMECAAPIPWWVDMPTGRGHTSPDDEPGYCCAFERTKATR